MITKSKFFLFLSISTLISVKYTFAVEDSRVIEISYKEVLGWYCGKQLHSYKALQKSCRKIISDNNYSKSWKRSCKEVLIHNANTNRKARRIIQKNFVPFLISDNKENYEGLFTGYYEPVLQGSRVKTDFFSTPIYGTPRTLAKQKDGNIGITITDRSHRYYTRKEITDFELLPDTDVIAWINSKVELSFLQIQGSGRIKFPNGSSILVGYDTQNGHPYRPIGRYFIDNDIMSRSDISMQSIKKWLQDNPAYINEVLNYDPSYVFFRILNHIHPLGAQGVSLTPKFSIAIDSKYYQYGTPIWVETSYKTPENSIEKIVNLFIAQDTGGAINGQIRGDIFWGSGKYAEFCAGHMKNRGKMIVFLPKSQNIIKK